jgi:hypothetical protein
MELFKAEQLAKSLIRNHLSSRGTWGFKFDSARYCFGRCKFNKDTGGVIITFKALNRT